MSDFEKATKKLLTIPPNFVPYMEKHRLYEFFYVIKLHHCVIAQILFIDLVMLYYIVLHFVCILLCIMLR